MQWLIQSHLSTEDYNDATAGLRRVRRLRRFTQWARYPSALFVGCVNTALSIFHIRRDSESKFLLWTKDSHYHPDVGQSIVRLAHDAQHLPFCEIDKHEQKGETSGNSR
jgi:hypothetical protein